MTRSVVDGPPAIGATTTGRRSSSLTGLFIAALAGWPPGGRQREHVAGPDIHGLDTHEIVAVPAAVQVGGEAVRMPEPGTLHLVTNAPGVGKFRLLHLAGEVLAKRRFRLRGEVVARLFEHSPANGHELIEFVGGEIDMVRDPRPHPGIGLEELFHSAMVARENYHELIAVILHNLEEDVDRFLAEVLWVRGPVEVIRLVDE